MRKHYLEERTLVRTGSGEAGQRMATRTGPGEAGQETVARTGSREAGQRTIIYIAFTFLKIVADRKERIRKSVLRPRSARDEIIRIELLVTSTVNTLLKSTDIVTDHSFQKTQRKVSTNLRRFDVCSEARIIKIIQQTI